ncbi:hypothetical protein [Leptospira perdikensis]|uniref:Dolichyl-phosphate-mannose--protein mannosyltransferase n=1 Tax=Leptospira perdikensis TaxID=2484948 RepID=A0A4R9JCR7_9LEPT|nr:hypothetical protein [Leptospira perdikensis]TGL37272.1 hypothetical protein EHQ49_13600 [Leptospira perdikensis]
MSIQSPKPLSFFLFFLSSTIINFLLCETIYFESLHSADHLYLPLFVKDLVSSEGVRHWFLPPSPYFFPDLILNLILYPLVPFLYLPSAYGTLQMFFVLLGICVFLSQYTNKTDSLQFLYRLEFIFICISLLGYWTSDHPLPFVYFLSQAHHSTGFFFSLLLAIYLYSLLNDKTRFENEVGVVNFLPLPFTLFFFIGFSLLYLSDRFSFSVGAISFFVVRIWDTNLPLSERVSYFQKKRFWSLAILFLFLNELIFWGLKQTFHIPGSFQILGNYLANQPVEKIPSLAGTYLWDFSKHIYYQGKSILVLLGLVLIGFPKFPKLIRHLLIVFFPVLLGLLLLVGRFTYLHPYPIRYLFPLGFFGILGTTWVFLSYSRWISTFQFLLLFSAILYLLTYLPFPRDRVSSQFSRITDGEVPYDLEKPIRFWSKSGKTPIPIGKDGKPYHWITGAFHTNLTE